MKQQAVGTQNDVNEDIFHLNEPYKQKCPRKQVH